VASAIIVAAGATALGLNDIARATFPPRHSSVEVIGAALLFAGGLLFVIEYIRSWVEQRRRSSGPELRDNAR
jgi:hypothetical protein